MGVQLLCGICKLMHIAPPLIRILICAAYPLQGVRISRGLIEMVEPSSCPAAICWNRCARTGFWPLDFVLALSIVCLAQ